MAGNQSLREFYKFVVFGFGNGFRGSVGGRDLLLRRADRVFDVFDASAFQIGLVTAIFWAGFAIPQVWAAYATETYTIKRNSWPRC